MADTFTALLRVVLQETGGNQNTWGSVNNTSAIQLLEEAVAGRVAISVTAADVVLTTANGASDQARNAVLSITGNPGVARNVTVPSTNKTYIVSNETSPGFNVTIKTSAGAGVVVQAGQIVLLYVDSTLDNVFSIDSSVSASETQAGVIEIATQAEVTTGLDDLRALTPLKLKVAQDLSLLTAKEGNALASGDLFRVRDVGTSLDEAMAFSDAGIPVNVVTGTSDTLDTGDINRWVRYTNASAISVILNTGFGKVGNFMLIQQGGAGTVTVSGTATRQAANGVATAKLNSVMVLFVTAAGTWAIYGDTS